MNDLNTFIIEQAQEVERSKINALFSIDYNFVAGRSTMKKCSVN